jgi:hypothetical protein
MSFLKEQFVSRLPWCSGCISLAIAMILCAGCVEKKSDVKGKVSYNGKAVEKGEVTLLSSKGTTHFGEIQSDGTYIVKGVPSGMAKLKVGWIDESAIEYNRQLAMKMRENKGGGIPKDKSLNPKAVMASPEKYADFDKSGLTVDVQGTVTEFNIEIKD